jgi:hypothetical protein
MIYFSAYPKVVMQRIQDAIVRSNCVLLSEVEMTFNCNEDFNKFVEKWIERYQLTLSPKERFKLKKKGNPTFDLVIAPNIYHTDDFTKDMVHVAKNAPERYEGMDFDFLNTSEHYLPIKFFLFCNIDSPKIYEKSLSIDHVNKALKDHIDGAEKFTYIFDSRIIYRNYELVRLTQKRSIKDDLEGSEKNSFDWTWRIASESYSKVQGQGETLLNRWHQYSDKTEEEKKAYFEKHLNVLENYYGFRGVRKQVGTLWARERKILKEKYGEKALQYYRPLKLHYVQRL